jgi:hypothetical protein
MNKHLRQPQETPIRQYFTKTLILQGFQAAKNRVFSHFCSFSPYFGATINILYTNKNAETLMFAAF